MKQYAIILLLIINSINSKPPKKHIEALQQQKLACDDANASMIDELSTRIIALQQKLASSEAVVSAQKHKIDAQEATQAKDFFSLHEQLSSLRQRIELLLDEKRELQQENAKIRDEKIELEDGLQSQVYMLCKQLKEISDRAQSFETQIAQQETDMANLRQTISNLTSEACIADGQEYLKKLQFIAQQEGKPNYTEADVDSSWGRLQHGTSPSNDLIEAAKKIVKGKFTDEELSKEETQKQISNLLDECEALIRDRASRGPAYESQRQTFTNIYLALYDRLTTKSEIQQGRLADLVTRTYAKQALITTKEQHALATQVEQKWIRIDDLIIRCATLLSKTKYGQFQEGQIQQTEMVQTLINIIENQQSAQKHISKGTQKFMASIEALEKLIISRA